MVHPVEVVVCTPTASSCCMNLQEKWLEEQKADIVDLEGQLTSAQAQAAELQERLADADTSHIDQVRPNTRTNARPCAC